MHRWLITIFSSRDNEPLLFRWKPQTKKRGRKCFQGEEQNVREKLTQGWAAEIVLLPDSESEMEIMSDDDDESDPLWNPTPGASFTYATLQPVQPVDDPTEDLPLIMLNCFDFCTGVDDQFDAGEATTFPTTEAQPSPIQSTSSSPIFSSNVPTASMKTKMP